MFIPNQGRWMLSVQQQGFIYLFYYQFEKKKNNLQCNDDAKGI